MAKFCGRERNPVKGRRPIVLCGAVGSGAEAAGRAGATGEGEGTTAVFVAATGAASVPARVGAVAEVAGAAAGKALVGRAASTAGFAGDATADFAVALPVAFGQASVAGFALPGLPGLAAATEAPGEAEPPCGVFDGDAAGGFTLALDDGGIAAAFAVVRAETRSDVAAFAVAGRVVAGLAPAATEGEPDRCSIFAGLTCSTGARFVGDGAAALEAVALEASVADLTGIGAAVTAALRRGGGAAPAAGRILPDAPDSLRRAGGFMSY